MQIYIITFSYPMHIASIYFSFPMIVRTENSFIASTYIIPIPARINCAGYATKSWTLGKDIYPLNFVNPDKNKNSPHSQIHQFKSVRLECPFEVLKCYKNALFCFLCGFITIFFNDSLIVEFTIKGMPNSLMCPAF